MINIQKKGNYQNTCVLCIKKILVVYIDKLLLF